MDRVYMPRKHLFTALLILTCAALCGCSRAIREGAGAATGASGKMFELKRPSGLREYKGFEIGDLTVSEGLKIPSNITRLLKSALAESSQAVGLSAGANPTIRISGEVIHYESGSSVSKAIGPLQEIVLRAQLADAASNQMLGKANLIGRSKALTSSGSENLCEGVGKALIKWFEEHGFEEQED